MDSKTLFSCSLVAWFAFNVADAVWIYFWVQTDVYPTPRNALDRTHSGWEAFQWMGWIFGFILSIINICLCWNYFAWYIGVEFAPHQRWQRRAFSIVNIFIGFPVAIILIVTPFCGFWILESIEKPYAWKHACSNYAYFAELDGRSYKQAAYTPDVLRFYIPGMSSSAFTYDLVSTDGSDYWEFHLREFDVEQSSIPVEAYPTLQQITYDFIHNTLNGTCTAPTSGGNVSMTPCMQGTFDIGSYLTFNLTSFVPLNTTTVPPSETTLLRSKDKGWTWSSSGHPAFILDTVNEDDSLGMQVMHTSVLKPSDCTQLKVCIPGSGEEGSGVGAEVLAPLGIALFQQSAAAIACTTPKDDQ